jgi:hypothetical protein
MVAALKATLDSGHLLDWSVLYSTAEDYKVGLFRGLRGVIWTESL